MRRPQGARFAKLQPETGVTGEMISTLAALMRENGAPLRRGYLRPVIDEAEVGDAELRIHGWKDVPARLVMGGGATPAGITQFCSEVAHPRGFEPLASAFGGQRKALRSRDEPVAFVISARDSVARYGLTCAPAQVQTSPLPAHLVPEGRA